MSASSPSRTACSPEALIGNDSRHRFRALRRRDGQRVVGGREAARRLEARRSCCCGADAAVRLRRLGRCVRLRVRAAQTRRGADDRPGGAARARLRRALRSQCRECGDARQSRRRQGRRRPRSWARTNSRRQSRSGRSRARSAARAFRRAYRRTPATTSATISTTARWPFCSESRPGRAQCSFTCQRRPGRVRRARIRAGFRRPTQSAP